jgi:proteasome accessory factor A
MLQKIDGKMVSAIDHQRGYLALAQKHLAHQNSDTEWVLTQWEETLNALEDDPMTLTDRLDWVAKKWLLETFVESEGIEWDDPWLQSIDLEYHNIDLEEGLFYGLQMQRIVTDEHIHTAIHTPPLDTRAYFRGKSLNKFEDSIKTVQWDSITFEIKGKPVTVNMNSLANPEIARKYNEALDLSPNPQTLVEKLGLS